MISSFGRKCHVVVPSALAALNIQRVVVFAPAPLRVYGREGEHRLRVQVLRGLGLVHGRALYLTDTSLYDVRSLDSKWLEPHLRNLQRRGVDLLSQAANITSIFLELAHQRIRSIAEVVLRKGHSLWLLQLDLIGF